MFRAFFRSREWFWYAYAGGAVLLVSLYLQVQMSVGLNNWYRGFYTLLQKADSYLSNPSEGIQLFTDKLISFHYTLSGFSGSPSFSEIVIPYMFLAMATSYLTRRWGLWWREAITFNYIPRWRRVEQEIEGSSQRIQEDVNRFARIVESLGLQVVRALMTLIAFGPVLWTLSAYIEVPWIQAGTTTFIDTLNMIEPSQVDGVRFVQTEQGVQVTNNSYFPGFLVWISVLATGGGMLISWFVGWYLPKLEYHNQVREAAFRKELVYGEDDKVNFADIPTLTQLFTGIRVNYKRLYLHYGYFDLWSWLYAQVMVIVPFLVAGPSLFTGAVLLGVLMQVSNAFDSVHGSFSIFINNWTTITELRSIRIRLKEFEQNLDKYAPQTA